MPISGCASSDIDRTINLVHNTLIMSGEAIKKTRKALRLKQTEFAALCSIRPETLSRIEGGKDRVPGYVDMIAFLLARDENAIKQAMERMGLL